MRLSLVRATPLAVGAVLVLAGCTGGGDPAPTESAGASTESPSDEESAEPEEDDAATAGGPECLEGTWDADLQAAADAMGSMPGIGELNPVIEVTGSSTVTFDGTTMTTEYVDQSSSVTVDVNGAPMTTRTSMDGTLTASYTATDGEITVADVDLSGVTISNTTVVDGQETEVPGLESAEASGVPLGGVSTYTCTDTRLELVPQVEGIDTAGFVQVLTRD
ncbi:hypothetical protein ICW40_19345 [Actinotalea ferrariae]|uniref:hypothetical protein n=1 Tax=Actinotalea ferrariae TaxID=1386098 RepID=UPI001C8C25A7|nr:hypothetical protein [Actinotalea ferrariae]MBX9246950.1 hypothetical protein [Actinotalea ferrariae]